MNLQRKTIISLLKVIRFILYFFGTENAIHITDDYIELNFIENVCER